MKQLRALLFTALLLVSSLALSAQTTKYAAIIKALGQTELLDEDRRTQLATLLAQDSALSLPLELDLGAKLLAVSEHSLRLQTSPVGTAELRLLPLTSGQGPLTALIETVSSPQVDARISFLSASGEALPSTTLLRLPSSEDFLRGLQLPMSTASDRLRELLYPLHYELSWARAHLPPPSSSAPPYYSRRRTSKATSSRPLSPSSPHSPRLGAVSPSPPLYAPQTPKHK